MQENVKVTHPEDRNEFTSEIILETVLSGLFCESDSQVTDLYMLCWAPW